MNNEAAHASREFQETVGAVRLSEPSCSLPTMRKLRILAGIDRGFIVSGSLSGCCDLMASVCCQQCSQPELAELQSKQSCRCDPANK